MCISDRDNGYFGKTNKAVTYTFSEPKHVAGFRLVVDSDLNREFVEGNPDGLNTTSAVSYTHLDVDKRQSLYQ